jgi:hypothetical protein
MTIHAFTELPPPDLASQLSSFERQFRYPLGNSGSFRIEHDADYSRFYRAMGDARCFVSEGAGEVLGVLSAVIRDLQAPDGSRHAVAYIGDLKLAPHARFGMTLPDLTAACIAWASLRAVAAFGIVMDGTTNLPDKYSGRVGIPGFDPLGHIVVLRFKCRTARGDVANDNLLANDQSGRDCYRELSMGRYACPLGCSGERSEVMGRWFVTESGDACGFLEDTRRAKRLIGEDDVEMQSAHLSCLAYRDVPSAASLLRTATIEAARLGYPALFTAVAAKDADSLLSEFADFPVIAAPATVYGFLLQKDFPWNVNSSEI